MIIPDRIRVESNSEEGEAGDLPRGAASRLGKVVPASIRNEGDHKLLLSNNLESIAFMVDPTFKGSLLSSMHTIIDWTPYVAAGRLGGLQRVILRIPQEADLRGDFGVNGETLEQAEIL